MSDKVKKDVDAAADELNQEAGEEKTKLDQIGEDVANLTDMVKSQTGTDEKKPDEEKPEIDVNEMTIEDMAKAISDSEDPEGQVKELLSQCNPGLEHLLDENGERHFDDEMLKSLQDSEDERTKVLNGIILAGKAQTERYEKAFGVMANLAVGMTKALSAVTAEMTEMKKSFANAPVKEDADLAAGEEETVVVPPVNGETSAPISKDATLDAAGPKYTDSFMLTALNKSFFNTQPDKYYLYSKLLGKVGADRLYNELDNSNKPSERDDAVAISAYLS